MSRHYDRERDLQGRMEAVLASELPHIDVLDVELDDAQETVRVFVDRAEGIGFEDCEAVTHAIRDTCPDHALEVSSPGLERPMRAARHLRDVIGETVRLRREGVHRARNVEIVDVSDSDGMTVRPAGGEDELVPFEQIVRCKLVVGDPFAAASDRKGRT